MLGVSMLACNPSAENKSGIDSSNTTAVKPAAPVENELAYLIGQQWTGGFDDNTIALQIKQVEPAGNGVYSASGFNTVAGNKRPIAGTLKIEGDKVKFTLKEPGDHKHDGSFTGTIYPSDQMAMRGSWTAYKRDRTVGFSLENNNSAEVQTRKKEEIVEEARKASEFYPSAQCVVTAKKTWFYSVPDYNGKKSAFLIEGDQVIVEKVVRNFVFVAYYNEYSGKSTSGWLDIGDLEIIQ